MPFLLEFSRVVQSRSLPAGPGNLAGKAGLGVADCSVSRREVWFQNLADELGAKTSF